MFHALFGTHPLSFITKSAVNVVFLFLIKRRDTCGIDLLGRIGYEQSGHKAHRDRIADNRRGLFRNQILICCTF